VPAAVTVGIVTWNSARFINHAMAAVRQQTHPSIELHIIDNASGDGTRELVERATAPHERTFVDQNLGFSAAHNLMIARSRAPYYLALNPDVFARPDYVEILVNALDTDDCVGSATGKLLQADDPTRIDSTGIYLVPAQRHFDRGQGEIDCSQFNIPDQVFGVSAAAALYRRAMLDDVAVDGEVFDEDFFAYREDADLAWRACLRGWRAWYVPSAVALHVRRVTPGRRARLPPAVNRMSVRNRFLLRIKNQPISQLLRFAPQALVRDLQVVGYTLLREHSSLPALTDVVRLLPRMWRKRRHILGRRRVPIADLNAWFYQRSRPRDIQPT
jgi:GT2 family glycosyltransferase